MTIHVLATIIPQTMQLGSQRHYLITIMIKTEEEEIPLPIDKVTIIQIGIGRVIEIQ